MYWTMYWTMYCGVLSFEARIVSVSRATLFAPLVWKLREKGVHEVVVAPCPRQHMRKDGRRGIISPHDGASSAIGIDPKRELLAKRRGVLERVGIQKDALETVVVVAQTQAQLLDAAVADLALAQSQDPNLRVELVECVLAEVVDSGVAYGVVGEDEVLQLLHVWNSQRELLCDFPSDGIVVEIHRRQLWTSGEGIKQPLPATLIEERAILPIGLLQLNRLEHSEPFEVVEGG